MIGLRSWHRAGGVLLVLPFLGWAVTGFVFFVKPGYAQAYASLHPKTYALEQPLELTPRDTWRSLRVVRSVLGDHLLVETDQGSQHLRLDDLSEWAPPDERELRRLIDDAITTDRGRYGQIERVEATTAYTDTGVSIEVDWNEFSFFQRGQDTDRIDLLYRVHYLRWTGYDAVDRLVGVVGLTLVLFMAASGCWLFFQRASPVERARAASPEDVGTGPTRRSP